MLHALTRRWQLQRIDILANLVTAAKHNAEAVADSLYEAALTGLKAISEGWGEQPEMATPISVSIVAPEHLPPARSLPDVFATQRFDKLRAWKCFDADAGKDTAREIREYFIPDFSRWKDGAYYQVALQRFGSRSP